MKDNDDTEILYLGVGGCYLMAAANVINQDSSSDNLGLVLSDIYTQGLGATAGKGLKLTTDISDALQAELTFSISVRGVIR